MKSIICLLSLCLTSIVYCQAANIKIRLDSVLINKNKYYQIVYTVTNQDTVDYWLWFDKDNNENTSHSEACRRYFYQHHNGGETLFSILLDVNNAIVRPSIYSTFVKKIEPQNQFSIILQFQNIKNAEQLAQTLKRQIVLLSKYEVLKHIKGADYFLDVYFFQKNVIVIPASKIQ